MSKLVPYGHFGVAAAAIVSAACLISCANKGEAVVSNEAAVSDAAPSKSSTTIVPAVKVKRANLANTVVLTAEFEPYQEVDVMAKVSGYVKSIRVDIGDRVREGQLLATLEVPEMQDDLAKAAASVQQARAEVAAASDEVRRAKSAHEIAHISHVRILDVSKKEKGLVPQQEVDEAHSRDLVGEAQVSVAESNLRTAQDRVRVAQAEQARLQTLFKYTSITAPFDGVVTKRYANIGSMIQAGISSQTQAMPVVRLSQNNLLRLVLPVPESSVPLVRVGAAVDVHVASLHTTFPGRIARFAGMVQESTRTMETQVDVPNPSLKLVPGMYAEVDLQTASSSDALSVPLEAVEGTDASAHVYAIRPPGVIHITPVRVGMQTAQSAEILSGLQEGDTVIIGRLAGLKDGQKVQAKFEER
jgi:RND family efflux transporter MFP subunit